MNKKHENHEMLVGEVLNGAFICEFISNEDNNPEQNEKKKQTF